MDGWHKLFAGGGLVSGYDEDVVEFGKGQHLFGVVGGFIRTISPPRLRNLVRRETKTPMPVLLI